MTKDIVKALVLISHNVDGEREATGKYTKFGDPEFRGVSKHIEPFSLFDIGIFPPKEQQWLRDNGSVCDVDDVEMALWEKLSVSERATKTFDEVRPGTTFDGDW